MIILVAINPQTRKSAIQSFLHCRLVNKLRLAGVAELFTYFLRSSKNDRRS